MKSKTVLVTGIGGNVGQGILRNIRAYDASIKIIGTNTVFLSAGNYLCDRVYEVPFSDNENYIPVMRNLCSEESVDLIIPSTDFETVYLSAALAELPTVAVSPHITNVVFNDKYLCAQHFEKHNLPFAKSFLPSAYKENFNHIIAKPRKGRGSRGIFIDPADLSVFSDEDYVIQELVKGTEITTAFYINRSKKLHGHITLERGLENGTTTSCIVQKKHDAAMEKILLGLINSIEIKGSCNLQSIVTSNGDIIPFEVNSRISGTNSIRSQFGFKDVQYVLEEFLLNIAPSTPQIRQGASTRILMDVIYTGINDLDEIRDRNTPHFIF